MGAGRRSSLFALTWLCACQTVSCWNCLRPLVPSCAASSVNWTANEVDIKSNACPSHVHVDLPPSSCQYRSAGAARAGATYQHICAVIQQVRHLAVLDDDHTPRQQRLKAQRLRHLRMHEHLAVVAREGRHERCVHKAARAAHARIAGNTHHVSPTSTCRIRPLFSLLP